MLKFFRKLKVLFPRVHTNGKEHEYSCSGLHSYTASDDQIKLYWLQEQLSEWLNGTRATTYFITPSTEILQP